VAPAEHYDRFMGRYARTLATALADAAGVRAGMRVLDVGCGRAASLASLPGGSAPRTSRQSTPSLSSRRHVATAIPAPGPRGRWRKAALGERGVRRGPLFARARLPARSRPGRARDDTGNAAGRHRCRVMCDTTAGGMTMLRISGPRAGSSSRTPPRCARGGPGGASRWVVRSRRPRLVRPAHRPGRGGRCLALARGEPGLRPTRAADVYSARLELVRVGIH
jgi:hypothetical protein